MKHTAAERAALTCEFNSSLKGTPFDIPIPVDPACIPRLIQSLRNQQILNPGTLHSLLSLATQYFTAQPNVPELLFSEKHPVIVVGDVHGLFFDVCSIFSTEGMPNPEN
ncbi:hypothetical protein KIPB_010734, partial [Kipferlia bialata]|eukprot:g10734.t1